METEDKDIKKQNVFKEEQDIAVIKSNSTNTDATSASTSTGLDQNIAGLLAYLFGFISGIVFLIIEKENKFVRYHAWQSIMVFVSIFLLGIILSFIPFIGIIFSLLLTPVSLILWVLLMWKAYNGEMYKLPFVGDLAEEQTNK